MKTLKKKSKKLEIQTDSRNKKCLDELITTVDVTKERIKRVWKYINETSQTEKQKRKSNENNRTEYLDTVDVNNFINIDNGKM